MWNKGSRRWALVGGCCVLASIATAGCGKSESGDDNRTTGAAGGDEGTGAASSTGGRERGGAGPSGGTNAGGAGPVGGDQTGGSDASGGANPMGGSDPGGAAPTGGTSTGGAGPNGGAATGGTNAGGDGPTGGVATGGTGGAPPDTECNDGIDNDGDGLVDWQYDVGCYSALDGTEASGPRDEEAGWTTFDLSPDSRVVYVSSSEGDDANDGLTPETAVATPARGAELVRDGSPDFLLFKRGDTWRAQDIGPDRVGRRFKSGQDAEHPIVIYSYGDSTERPRLEIDKNFIDHDGNERSYVAIVGLAFISYPKVPDDPAFDGQNGGGLRLIGTGNNVLVEDNYFEYSEIIVQNEVDVEVRRNVVYRSYEVGTCAYDSDGSRDPNGNSDIRPSGMFAGGVDGLTIEGNVWDQNGWNPDVDEACATIYNHDLYLSGNSRLAVTDNLILRASSIGIKMSSGGEGECDDVLIDNNVFAEGEIGISMGGNADTQYRFRNAVVSDNVFTDIGRDQPTTRSLTWYIELSDNDGTRVENNLLVNQPPLSNPYGVHMTGGTNRDVTIASNFFHGLSRRQLLVDADAAWSSITVETNTFIGTTDDECLISHSGGFGAFTYGENAYASAADAGTWFCVDGTREDLAGWASASGETGAAAADASVPDAGRNLDSYAAELGIGSTLADFAAAARQQSRHSYRPELSATSAGNYIRGGYGVPLR